MAETLTLYQAEWCPFSSAVREVLTELGLDFVARQVEPWPDQRKELKQVTETDQIPVLVADGQLYRGTREISDTCTGASRGGSPLRTAGGSHTTRTRASRT
jgi:glutaredoxin